MITTKEVSATSREDDLQQGHPAPTDATSGEKTQGHVDAAETAVAADSEFKEGGYGWYVGCHAESFGGRLADRGHPGSSLSAWRLSMFTRGVSTL